MCEISYLKNLSCVSSFIVTTQAVVVMAPVHMLIVKNRNRLKTKTHELLKLLDFLVPEGRSVLCAANVRCTKKIPVVHRLLS